MSGDAAVPRLFPGMARARAGTMIYVTAIGDGEARAHWIDRETLVWTVDPSLTHALTCAPEGGLTCHNNTLTHHPTGNTPPLPPTHDGPVLPPPGNAPILPPIGDAPARPLPSGTPGGDVQILPLTPGTLS
ncbi:MAG: hypothetical protein HOY71_55800, partial [Nonomuraea sp.]|nr:hypothetical protein [Nonomuraea sp.]